MPWFSGGFIGVDVFFVISGFLITTLLLNELRDKGSINLPAFFARRARRLLPAFFLVVVATLILGFLIIVPIEGEYRKFANSAVTAALYASNLYFATAGDGYFDDPALGSPLLHTWSLAVEEQFYLLWPVLLLFAIWLTKRWRFDLLWIIVGVLIVIFVSSLTYSWSAAESGGRAARLAFFVLPARAWELGIGAFLALALPNFQRSHNSLGAAMAVAGVAIICGTIWKFDESTPFPGTAALLPTVGTAAVIAGTWLAPRATASRLLACSPAVAIGLVSYSWYLWHWPLMTFAREFGYANPLQDAGVAMVALGLAWATYVYVEEPIRRRRIAPRLGNLATLGIGAGTSLLVIQLAFVLSLNATWSTNTDIAQRLERAENDTGWSTKRCFHRDDNFHGVIPISNCTGMPKSSKKILVFWGDSHATALVGILETAAQDKFALLPRPMSRCPPVIDLIPLRSNKPNTPCVQFNNAILAEIYRSHQEGRLAGVVLAARWRVYRYALAGDPAHPLADDAAIEAFEQALRSTVRMLVARDIRVLVVAPVPEHRFDILHCLARHSPEFCNTSRTVIEKQRSVVLRALERAVDGLPRVQLWDPLPALCEESGCFATRDGIILYRDDSHLTYTGSRWLGSFLRNSSAWDTFLLPDQSPQATKSD